MQKLQRNKEAELSQETAATIENMKKYAVDNNYFGILLGKNNHHIHSNKNKSTKRNKGIYRNDKSQNLLSHGITTGLMRSMDNQTKGKFN